MEYIVIHKAPQKCGITKRKGLYYDEKAAKIR